MHATNHSFIGRKPSETQCIAAVRRLAATGAQLIELTWGENWLQLHRDAAGYWTGLGFIKNIDACVIARKVNHA
jgi:hypothetical protein